MYIYIYDIHVYMYMYTYHVCVYIYAHIRLQNVGVRSPGGLYRLSFFPLFWDQRTVIFQLSGFYCSSRSKIKTIGTANGPRTKNSHTRSVVLGTDPTYFLFGFVRFPWLRYLVI